MPDTAAPLEDKLVIAGKAYTSRLIVGTGKYASYAQNAEAAEAAGAEIVTVALRRVNVADKGSDRLVDHLDPKTLHLPAQHGGLLHGGRSRAHAAPGARGGRMESLVKLEVLAEHRRRSTPT